MEITPQTDIYSFGMILWELLHGTVPFDNDMKTVVNYVVKEDLRPKILPHVPSSVASLIRQCWQADPSKRQTSFAELCEQFDKILEE